MKPVPVTIYDGTNTTTVNRINAPAGSVDPNGVLDLGQGIKVYRALLTQSGTDAPVATVLENTLDGEVVWTRDSTGSYFGTLAGAFPANKVFTHIQGYLSVTDWADGSTIVAFSINRSSDNAVNVQTVSGNFQAVWGGADDQLTGQSVEILVYP